MKLKDSDDDDDDDGDDGDDGDDDDCDDCDDMISIFICQVRSWRKKPQDPKKKCQIAALPKKILYFVFIVKFKKIQRKGVDTL